jgi:hypothetical protein
METFKNLNPVIKQFLWLPFAILGGLVVYKAGLVGAVGLIMIIVMFFLLRYLYLVPKNGVFIALLISFFVNGITRYIVDSPLGLSIDFILVLTLIIAVFSPVKGNLKNLNSGVFWFSMVWFAFTVAELFNPEARSKEAWFYAVRAVSLYQIFVVVVALLYINSFRDLKYFVHINLGIIALSVLWAAKQMYIGLDAGETTWLAEGAYRTHILRGVLRTFSFFSDAGQFGATAAYAGLVGFILALGPFKPSARVFYLIVGILGFWGMLMSGTRGALFVPASGVFVYLIATRNIRIFIIGLIVVVGAYSFLKYTTILNENNQMRRLRSALDPNDPSLQVRLENQRKFKIYLATRPIGGGIGTSGTWGIRFTPGTFLAETANDSWYVKIWAETGVIGLYLHIAMIMFFVFYGYYVIFKINDPPLKSYIMAIHAGFFGIACAAYGNPILGQFPLSIMLYTTWAFFVIAPGLDSKKTIVSDELSNT